MKSGLVHRHKSRRAARAGTLWQKLLDRTTLVAGVIGPLTDIPQILKLLVTHNATGISLLAWSGAAILDIPFLLYGLAHKDRAITITYALWLAGNTLIVILILLYS